MRSPVMYQPAGFQGPNLRRRAPVIPFRRRGFGDAASDYASIAAQMARGSAMQQLFQGCAANPSAPACAGAAQAALSTPYLTGPEYQATVAAIAAGQAPPPVTAYTGPPPGTQLPTAPTAPPAPVVQQTAAPSTITATPNIQPIAAPALQPAPVAAPVATGVAAPSLLSTTFLGFPLWLWGVAALGGFLIFSESGGRRGR